ncbi:5-oxoprolinase/urea amidolyase family protein [Kineococcus radiotolerans]|uniref:Urea amidolyase related protein n=1 Tax=Kineococcus radiotolerans (strain ATCC BAA-149 / DSM 14245 / SRS30216) TaxID=266940 RepID=A6W5D3_KINRD|nr:5-oxoprolinase/urea amidolyase family protein [Kineococcus radiotolerans]ABS02022.1 urea amidolyase related protein [Kineococcus radiotolerans SRS30216 = ATCC BAA-149]
MRFLPVSDTAVMVELRDLDETTRLFTALTAADLPGVREVVPAARTILVVFDPRRVTPAELVERLRAVEPAARAAGAGRSVTLDVRYDGQDLAEVAGLLGVSAEELVRRHQAATWTVAFTGYAPGFGYLVGDDELFDVPRRSSPRTRIPAGSVGLAGRFSGVYPRESPGGWQLIGRTDAAMWDIDRDPPALLAPGTTVRFTRVERELVPVRGPRPAPVASQSSVEVVSPGIQLVLQDLGRPGHLGEGVAASGAADRAALRAANRAVGNAPGTAVLELAGGGAALRFTGAGVLALAGASVAAELRTAGGGRLPVLPGPFAVEDGDELRFGAQSDGLRTVVAVRGGFDVPAALASLATDTLSGVGPSPLRAGDRLALHGPAAAPHAVDPSPVAAADLPRAGRTVDLDVVLGPRTDWFTPAALEALTTREWEVTPRSDRVGIRLAGTPLERSRDGELPSEGAVTGAIQVPPDGQPVLFGPDHPLTGGYPVIGAVVDAHLDLVGQLPPGARVRFHPRAPFTDL